MSDAPQIPPPSPGREVKPEGEEAHALAERWLTEPMILVSALSLILVWVVLMQAPAIWDAIVALFSR
jgi:hypothetical protein